MEETSTIQNKLNENTTEQEVNAQLIEAVRKQVEYYFSKENLQVDPFLTSQMDAQMSVPISVVMKFAKMKALTQSEDVLRQALVDSHLTILDNNRIKANIKAAGRSTIILRDIPSDTPMEEVQEIFNYPGCKPVNSIKSDVGDTWFVLMDTEDDAKDTLVDLRLKKRLFRGVSVKARLKTETVVRSFYPLQSPPIAPVGFSVPGMGFGGMLGPGVGGGVAPGMVPFPFMGMPMPGVVPMMVPMIPNAYMDPNAAAKVLSIDSTNVVAGGNTNTNNVSAPILVATSPIDNQKGQSNNGSKDNTTKKTNSTNVASSKQTNSNSTTNSNDKQNDSSNRSSSKGKSNENDSSNRNKSKGSNNSNNTHSSNKKDSDKPLIEVNVANFPPLGGNEEIPTPGYKGTFTKYSADEIINIAKTVKEIKLPVELDLSAHPSALSIEPNKDLLKRQRSFSIDETREQLRQGKPVQREAVIAGKVDSKSLLYGDEMNTVTSTQQTQASLNKPATTATNIVNTNNNEVEIMVASVVDQVTNSATELAISSSSKLSVDTTVGVSAPSPVKITPSSWAAMVKSSESSTQTSNKSPIQTNKSSESKKSTMKDTVDKIKSKPNSGNNSNSSSGLGSSSMDKTSSTALDGKNKNKNSADIQQSVDQKNKEQPTKSNSSSNNSSNMNNSNNKKNSKHSNNVNPNQNEQNVPEVNSNNVSNQATSVVVVSNRAVDTGVCDNIEAASTELSGTSSTTTMTTTNNTGSTSTSSPTNTTTVTNNNTTATTTTVGVWGSKISFATVLKQSTVVETSSATTTTSKSNVADASSNTLNNSTNKNNNKPTNTNEKSNNNNNNNKSNSHNNDHNSKGKDKNDHHTRNNRNSSNSNSNNKVHNNNTNKSNQTSNGLWVRETL